MYIIIGCFGGLVMMICIISSLSSRKRDRRLLQAVDRIIINPNDEQAWSDYKMAKYMILEAYDGEHDLYHDKAIITRAERRLFQAGIEPRK